MARLIPTGCLLALAMPTSLSAQDKLPDVLVPYADLDLSMADGIRTLDGRIGRAVKAACPSSDNVRDARALGAVRRCQAEKQAEVALKRQALLADAARRLTGPSGR